MRRISFMFIIATLIAGGGGYMLRRYELATAFEPSGLAIPAASATILLVSLTVFYLAAVIMGAAYISARYKSCESFEDAYGTYSTGYPLAFVPVWIIWIAGTVVHLLSLMSSGVLETIDRYFFIMSVLAAISVTFFSVEAFQNSKHKSLYALCVVPIAFLCFWLVLVYRQNATNPVLLNYVYMCMAIVASALCYYYTAGFIFGKPAPGRAIFAYCGAIYFCAITLADNPEPGISMIFGALLITGTINLYRLISNMLHI